MAPSTRSRNAKLDTDKNGEMKVNAKAEPKEEQTAAPPPSSGGGKREGDGNGGERPAKAAKTESTLPTDGMRDLSPGKREQDKDGEGSYRVLEQGIVYFFYRPKVQSAEETKQAAESIDDVQNTHMLLVPIESQSSTASIQDAKPVKDDGAQKPAATTGEEARKLGVGFRLIRLGKKRLPAPEQAIANGLEPGGIGGDSSEAIWAVVSDIGQSLEELAGEMGEKRYNTRTRGQRVVGASRPAGRGRYSIVLHEIEPPSNRSVQLVYALSHPSDMGDVQKELGLLTTGAVRIVMRNPTLPQTGQGAPPAGLDDKDRVSLSEGELSSTFGGSTESGGTRYARPENMELLDREGVELLLTRERYQDSNGGALQGAGKEQVDSLREKADKEGKDLSVQDVLKELALKSNENPSDAIDGRWI